MRLLIAISAALAASPTAAFSHVPPALLRPVRTAAPPSVAAAGSSSSASSIRMQAAAVAMPPQSPLPELQAPKTNAVSRVVCMASFGIIATVVVSAMYPFVLSAALIGYLFDNKRRRLNDFVVGMWARLTMLVFCAGVKVENAEVLPPAGEPVMYCPNHCSFLDIFALSGYLPRRFKYISKIEILRIPLIGWAMRFAKHIAIRRTDRASQLKTLKDAIETLKAGNSLVTFPEGTRSKDGRLCDFKKGPFTMAARAGVRIVPISIIGTHLFQPPGAFLPFAIPRGVRIVCHPPIDAPAEKKEDLALQATKEAILTALPESMQPLPKEAKS